LNELALFSGVGGGILGGKLLGWRTVCAVEQDHYCIAALAQRQNEGFLSPFPIWDDVCTFDGTRWRGIVDVVSGGFPCTDISVAGKGAGIKGKESGLWSEMARVISEVRPQYAFIENSPMLVVRGLDTVLCDLAKMGFDAKWGCISAGEVGANHKRDRIWIVARSVRNSDSNTNWDEKSRGNTKKNFVSGKNRQKDNSFWQSLGASTNTKYVSKTRQDNNAFKDIGGKKNVANTESIKCNERQTGNLSEKNKKKGLRGEIGTSCNNVADTQSKQTGQNYGRVRQRVSGIDRRQTTTPEETMADTRCEHWRKGNSGSLDKDKAVKPTGSIHTQSGSQGFCEDVANTIEQRSQRGVSGGQNSERQSKLGHVGCSSTTHGQPTKNWWSAEPNVGRVVNGMAFRVDRLKGIGNGQVPEVVRIAWEMLRWD
jgi:site-specific DNA-cytosine methylase